MLSPSPTPLFTGQKVEKQRADKGLTDQRDRFKLRFTFPIHG
jgi:hypothetical protein